MGQGTDFYPVIQLNENSLNAVDKFVHLRSILSSTLPLDEKMNAMLGKGAPAFGRLSNKAPRKQKTHTKNNVLIYKACVLSTLW